MVQLVGYLEGISSGVVLDLVTVSAYEAGPEQLLVPQRVDPEHPGELTPAAGPARSAPKSRREVDGSAAFGGEWYTKSLKQLKPGNRVFVYIPKGNGVGGYVGVGEVKGEAMLAKDFKVDTDRGATDYLAVTQSPGASQKRDDASSAEWVVPVRWIETRRKEEAVRDSDFFANQNSAVRLTHGYTLKRLGEEFEVEPQSTPSA